MKKVLIAVAVLSLTACSSVKYNQAVEYQAPKFGESKAGVPDWYYNNEKDGALYGSASEYSKDMQFAVDKAMMSAKRELAGNFSSHTSSMMKDYASEVGELNNDVLREINRTTKVVVSEVNLIGVHRTNFQIDREGTGFRAWVKVRYAMDDTNKLLLEEIRRNRALSLKLESSKSFKELENNVDKQKGQSKQVDQQVSEVKQPGVDNRPVE